MRVTLTSDLSSVGLSSAALPLVSTTFAEESDISAGLLVKSVNGDEGGCVTGVSARFSGCSISLGMVR